MSFWGNPILDKANWILATPFLLSKLRNVPVKMPMKIILS